MSKNNIQKVEEIDEVKYVQNFPSLVRYNNPISLDEIDIDAVDGLAGLSNYQTTPTSIAMLLTAGTLKETKKSTEDILNSIILPHIWQDDNGHSYRQTVSSLPSTRQDVINLKELLNTRLQQTQARKTGICPIRRELYTQCFDEIIRQVTINCPVRGLLLLRISDEIKMSLDAYETLYTSSVAFGMRKAMHVLEETEMIRERVEKLDKEKQRLEDTISDMKLKNEQIERRNAELRAAEDRKYIAEVEFLKKVNIQLKAQLDGITTPKK